jgi:hypothetical protein
MTGKLPLMFLKLNQKFKEITTMNLRAIINLTNQMVDSLLLRTPMPRNMKRDFLFKKRNSR